MAWHIDQMGQPPRLDVWACAQSSVWDGDHVEVVKEKLALAYDCVHVRQTWSEPENVNSANMEIAGGGTVCDSR